MGRTNPRAVVWSTLFLAACACGPDSPSASSELERARNLARQGRADEAVAAWRSSLARADSAGVRLELARALSAQHRVEDAAREYAHALQLDEESASAWIEFGRFAREQHRDPHGAELAFRKALELAPDSAEAHGNLGLALFDLADFEGASAELQAALSLGPKDAVWRADAENALVLAHLRQRELEQRR